MTKSHGGRVASVRPESIAEEAGILPGDLITHINGHPLVDVIDYTFYSSDEDIEVMVQRGDEEFIVSVEKDISDPIGVEFVEELFDGVRTCDNRCVFCFVSQLPKGMRRSLYLKDDDYRLSFLYGNFVTLTNLRESDIERIISQRLSPLYVSVHATEPNLRNAMLGGRDTPDIMEQLHRLADGGIRFHSQIVVCPGVNDGENLERTIRDLASFYPNVLSIGAAPVGLAAHRTFQPQLSLIDRAGAGKIIRLLRSLRREYMQDYGSGLVWASDEIYLMAGYPFPSTAAYEGFPQYENGIGIVRSFLDEEKKVIKRLPERISRPIKATVLTSTLAAPILEKFASSLMKVDGLSVNVKPIVNNFFGKSVTVTGLLTGRDIIEQMSGSEPSDIVLLPSIMLRDGVFLDDVTLEELSQALKCEPIAVSPTPFGAAQALGLIDP